MASEFKKKSDMIVFEKHHLDYFPPTHETARLPASSHMKVLNVLSKLLH